MSDILISNHYPVVNKRGDSIASALTTIDMHDIARAGKTFGIRGFFIVTPLEDQKKLAREVIDHWVCGVGGQLNPFRKQALELITIVTSFSDAVEEIKARDKKSTEISDLKYGKGYSDEKRAGKGS